MKAEHIARLIELTASAVFDRTLTLEEGSTLNEALWDLASAECCVADVDSILQQKCLEDTKESCQCKVR